MDRAEVERQLDSALTREGGGREVEVLRVKLLLDIRDEIRTSNLLRLADALDLNADGRRNRSVAAAELRNLVIADLRPS